MEIKRIIEREDLDARITKPLAFIWRELLRKGYDEEETMAAIAESLPVIIAFGVTEHFKTKE